MKLLYLTRNNYFSKVLLLCFLCACSKDIEKVKSEQKVSDKQRKELQEYKAEVELGRNMAGRLLQFYGVYSDVSLVGYINQVGMYVASYTDFQNRRFMFSVLDSDEVNAFACPGGYVLVTIGMLRNARSEAELAAVLGHEITHIGKQHMLKTLKKMGNKEQEKLAENVDNKLVENPHVKARKRPDAEKSMAVAVLARYLAGSTGAGFSLLRAAKAGMNVILEKGLDKELEYEADTEGVSYAIYAGYEPNAMVNFLTRLHKSRKHNKNVGKVLERTHPTVLQRKKRIAKLLSEMDSHEIKGAKATKRFMKYHKKIRPIKS